MALTRTPPDRWIEEGLRALADGGPDAVRIEPLAQTLGVSKGGFYWQFDDRGALLESMLDSWERASVDDVIERVEGGGGDAREKLRRLFSIAGYEPLRTELAIRDWARRDRTVAARLRRVDNRRMSYMRALFGEFCADEDEVETRCMLASSLWIGNHFIAAEHGRRTRGEVVRRALRGLIE
ncbi:MAG TPA: TetR/AcrR family transcriptional regulator [Solirubrobacterales bacterium]|jgi:AcrR family transcriptional regulator|nr:TetR/AcrR family transcriptional regulator [Solirubrobacterales bacterium]